MRVMVRRVVLLAALLETASAPATAQGFRQTQTDDYTRYELLDPGTHLFRIYYDVSATTAGARYYFNTLRAGSEHIVSGVRDLMTGKPLEWKIVTGAEARAAGMQNASENAEYLQVSLARPVPAGGQQRIRIDKTYEDTASYYARDDRIVFDRSLGIDRNAVVLPVDYEIVAVNFPSQVAQEPDGRLRVSFMNAGPAAVPYRVEARRLRSGGSAMRSADGVPPPGSGRTPPPGSARVPPPGSASVPPAGSLRTQPPGTAGVQSAAREARIDYEFTERAFENRDITYFLMQPETHSFRLFHDYTETRAGTDRYLNVVRAGSEASDPEAVLLDTGERLRVETLRGEQITRRGLEVGNVTAETEVVAIWFDPVPAGGSVRLRITETYTDPGRYLLHDGELVWDRSFGRARNTVVLPDGWFLTANSVPGVVDETEDGGIRLRHINDRPGDIDVFIKAKRR